MRWGETRTYWKGDLLEVAAWPLLPNETVVEDTFHEGAVTTITKMVKGVKRPSLAAEPEWHFWRVFCLTAMLHLVFAVMFELTPPRFLALAEPEVAVAGLLRPGVYGGRLASTRKHLYASAPIVCEGCQKTGPLIPTPLGSRVRPYSEEAVLKRGVLSLLGTSRGDGFLSSIDQVSITSAVSNIAVSNIDAVRASFRVGGLISRLPSGGGASGGGIGVVGSLLKVKNMRCDRIGSYLTRVLGKERDFVAECRTEYTDPAIDCLESAARKKLTAKGVLESCGKDLETLQRQTEKRPSTPPSTSEG